jgi:hypothetical protein
MTLVINPGSGPVPDATEVNAIENIKHFVVDLGTPDIEYCGDIQWGRIDRLDDDGRYGFLIWLDLYAGDVHGHYVEMPGLPLDQVRWMENRHQDIWDFPRLYVDGSSWVWKFALNCVDFNCGQDD